MAYRLIERTCRRWMWRLPKGQARIALTFDDGPDPITTPGLLKELDRLEIQATFFLNGELCAANRDILREAEASGHSLANHGFIHRSHLWRGMNFQKQNIYRTDQELRALGLHPQRFFRPPYGNFNPLTSPVLSSLNYSGVMWSLMVWDWLEGDKSRIWPRIQHGLHEGAIIVLHDSHPTTQHIIQLMPRLADECRNRGWKFVPLTSSVPS